MIETWHVYIGDRYIGSGRATEAEIRAWFPQARIVGRTVDVGRSDYGA